MKTAVVIPARFNSSRFPGKPLFHIDGVTLIQRTYQRVSSCKTIDLIVVATDDDRIAQHVKGFGGTVCMTPSSCETGTDRVGAAFKTHKELQSADLIINVQGDEPCILPSTIKAVQTLLVNPHIDIATCISNISSREELESTHVVKCALSHSNRLLYLSRLPIPGNKNRAYPILSYEKYKRHIGIYGFKKESLIKFISLPSSTLQKEEDIEIIRALEYDMNVYASHIPLHAPGVDIPEDVQLVKSWIQREIDILT
ncbi:MAG: 3-deoxy-manno-octulosonate cytidylyltransferase [Chlamydia sp.]